MAPSKDDERRARVVSHMNSQHARELSHYLRYYSHVPDASSRSAKLTDLSLTGMSIRNGTESTTHSIPFDPPLKNWEEVRPRVVTMAEEARQGLGLSDVFISEYVPPDTPLDVIMFGAVAFYIVCAVTQPWVKPGSPIWEALLSLGDDVPGWYMWLVDTIKWPVVGIHLLEAALFDPLRLRKYDVERFSAVWWLWELNVCIEGVTAWGRIDRLVKRKRAEKDSKAH